MAKFGLQLYSIKDAAEKDLLSTLEKVATMGYEGAQFAGFYDLDARDVQQKLWELHLKPAGAHVPLEDLTNDLERIRYDHDTIGNDLIICPSLPKALRTSREDYERIAEILNEIGRQLKNSGFTFAYHNHAFEFETYDDQTGFEILFEQTDPAFVKMELDCYWAAYAGYDPIEIIETYKDRCVTLHIKDLHQTDDEAISTELGSGTLPLIDYINKGNVYDVEWLVVEQEHFTMDPLISAEKNAHTMKQLLAGSD